MTSLTKRTQVEFVSFFITYWEPLEQCLDHRRHSDNIC